MLKLSTHKRLYLLFFAILTPSIILSQGLACPEFVQTAMDSLDESCSELGRNQVCYGHEEVQASFTTDVDADFFSEPSNTAPLADLTTIRTAPLNLETETWGLAIMNLQADLPNTLPGQNVTFILLGDAELENAVAPEDAFQPIDGIELTVNIASGANLRSGAGNNFNVVGGLANGETFIADGLSEDGAWLRLVHEDNIAWIERAQVADNETIASLPTLSDEQHTPMQAFYLRTGIGREECLESPDNLLLVQGPENINVSLNINGVEVRLGSTGALRVLELGGEPFLEVNVLEGEFEVDGVPVEAGERSVICLGNEDSRGLDGESNDLVVTCEPSTPERIAPADFNSQWCDFATLPTDLLNYPLNPCYPSHTVASGETLLRIAQHYCTTVDAIAALNTISNPNLITVGQQFFIPLGACENAAPIPTLAPILPTTSSNVAVTVSPEVTATLVPPIDCKSFAVDFSTVAPTPFTLLWTPATPSGFDVLVNVYGIDTRFSQSQSGITGAGIDLDGSTFPSKGFILVEFYENGTACASYRHYFDFDSTLRNFSAQLQCTQDTVLQAHIYYSGADSSTVTVTVFSDAYPNASESQTLQAPFGEFFFTLSLTDYMSSIVVNVDGTDMSFLGSCPPSS